MVYQQFKIKNLDVHLADRQEIDRGLVLKDVYKRLRNTGHCTYPQGNFGKQGRDRLRIPIRIPKHKVSIHAWGGGMERTQERDLYRLAHFHESSTERIPCFLTTDHSCIILFGRLRKTEQLLADFIGMFLKETVQYNSIGLVEGSTLPLARILLGGRGAEFLRRT